MVLTNLGVTLHRKRETEPAIESFAVAQRIFNAMNNPPGEAHALDCMAGAFAEQEQNLEAEVAWLKALDLYRGITSEALNEVRDAGCADIISKLERFYLATDQTDKINGLHQ